MRAPSPLEFDAAPGNRPRPKALAQRSETVTIPVDAPKERLHALGRTALFVAHEVKSMMAVARFGLAALEQGAAWGKATDLQMLHVLHAAVARAIALLDEILYFGTNRPLRRSPVSITEVVERVARLMRILVKAGLQRAAVTERYEAAPVLWVDEALLEASLTNLAFNGLQALQVGGAEGGRLDFAVSALAGEAIISIRNSGSPAVVVDLEELAKGGCSRKADGNGLGLIIARAAVEAHGGRLVFEATEDNGVRANVVLPLGPVSA